MRADAGNCRVGLRQADPGLVAFILCNTFLACVFVMNLIPHWHSTVFPIFYWFSNLPQETGPLWRQTYGHYGPYFWTMMAGCFFVPFAAFIFAIVKRSILAMCIVAFGINLGIWISKYLMVVPVFYADDRPFSSTENHSVI